MMFRPKKKSTIDTEVDHCINELGSMKPDTDQYKKIAENLQRLCDARSYKTSHSISPDSIIAAITNLLGILLILNYEKLGVISTKAVGLLLKTRL